MTQMRVPPSTTEDAIHDIAEQLCTAFDGKGTIVSYLVVANAIKFDDTELRATGATVCSEGLNPEQRIRILEQALAYERHMLTGA
jgi:hypothetical protein